MRTIPGVVTNVTDTPQRLNFRRSTPNWVRAVYAVVAGIVIIVALSLIFAPASGSLPPCVEEDGSGGPIPCYWDGSERGNGIGNDVIITEPHWK